MRNIAEKVLVDYVGRTWASNEICGAKVTKGAQEGQFA